MKKEETEDLLDKYYNFICSLDETGLVQVIREYMDINDENIYSPEELIDKVSEIIRYNYFL
jgi:hypothetical protein